MDIIKELIDFPEAENKIFIDDIDGCYYYGPSEFPAKELDSCDNPGVSTIYKSYFWTKVKYDNIFKGEKYE